MNKEHSKMMHTIFVCLGLILLILGIFIYVVVVNRKPERKREISVILYDAKNDGWETFQEGIKRAEDEFFVNVNCIIGSDSITAAEQYAAMEKEIEKGTEGIILAANDYEALYKLLIDKKFDVPVITVESGFDEDTIPLISADNYEMAKMLGEEILRDFSQKEDLTVALDLDIPDRDSVRKREQGILDALDGRAEIISLQDAAAGRGADAAVALHKQALFELAERTDAALKDTKRYGIGNTSSIVAALDQGKIEKLVFQNEFNMGYLAVEMMLGEIGSVSKKEQKQIDCYCVSNEELYEVPYEHLLFPIVK